MAVSTSSVIAMRSGGQARSTGSRFLVAESFTELARRYFRWIGPATLAEFQWFAGLGVKAAKDRR